MSDNNFIKTIYYRCCENNPQYKLLKENLIPVPKLQNDEHNIFDKDEVLKVVIRLKEIEKDIDWRRDDNGDYNWKAIEFLMLIEVIAGKRYSSQLSYLIWR